VKLSLVPITKELQKVPFECGYPVLNEYFKLYALKNDRLSIGKTFVAMDEAEIVIGYMTLASAQVAAQSFPAGLKEKLPRYPVPAFRIAKLAIDARFQGSGAGSWLLRQALDKALSVSAEVGLYAVIVDVIDEKAKGFYLKYGFMPFSEYPLTLFLPMATISRARSGE
jgi:GNAT superfamily N-acetyltransferase